MGIIKAYYSILGYSKRVYGIFYKLLAPLSFLGLLVSLPALAQYRNNFEQYAERIQKAGSIEAGGPNMLGEQVSLHDGGLGFAAKDVSLPGNSALVISIGRRYSAFNRRYYGDVGVFGDWELDIPRIEGVFAPNWSGASSASDLNRCSNPGAYPLDYFNRSEWWTGISLHLPDEAGGGDLLAPSSAAQKPSNGTFPLMTAGWSYVSCLSSIANGAGQGFQVITPGGNKYTFQWMAQYATPGMRKMEQTAEGVSVIARVIARKKNVLYVTRVEDRFGNYVTYNYSNAWNQAVRLDSITASDGRALTVSYNGQGKIAAITSNGRTWSYSYGTTAGGRTTLTSVKLPDNSQWNLSLGSITDAEVLYVEYANEGGCFALPEPNNAAQEYGGTLQHPSGLTGAFTVKVSAHNRSNVPISCNNVTGNTPYPSANGNNITDDYNRWPLGYWSLALKSKVLSGAGIATGYGWTYAYSSDSSAYMAGNATFDYPVCSQGLSCAQPRCVSEACAGTALTTVTAPDGSWTRYTHGNSYKYNENKLLSVEVGAIGSTVPLRKVRYSYDFTGGTALGYLHQMGWSLKSEDDGYMEQFQLPAVTSITVQDGVNFQRSNSAFDHFANPLTTVRSSSLGYSRTDTYEYQHNLALWVISQPKRVVNSDTGLVVSRTEYGANMLPSQIFAYEKLQQSLTYSSDGTLSTITDGRNNTTTLTNWKRDIPQNILFADGKTQSATVNDNGWITAVIDENGYSMGYGYDPMGRLSGVSYPSGDTVAWNTESTSFAGSTTSAYGLPAGHWRATRVVGSKLAITYYDALLRPVVEEQYDTTNPATTRTMIVKRYDADGHVVFQSYPRASIGSYTDNYPGITTTYDALGRATIIQQDSELGPLVTTTTYRTGFEVEVKNPKQFTTVNGYFVLDEPTYDSLAWSIQPEGKTIQIDRDALGFTKSLNQRNADESLAVTRRYVYDANMQLCKAIEPETGATVTDYDPAGNISWSASGLRGGAYESATDCASSRSAAYGSGRRISRSYDPRNRVTSLQTPDGRGNQTWSYYPDGLVYESAVDNEGPGQATVKTQYVYNKRRLLTGETLEQVGAYTWSLGYGYDENGSLSASRYPDSTIVTYSPNALGQARQLANAASGKVYASGVSYYANGGMSQFTYGNGIVHTMQQNLRQLPSRTTDSGVLNYGFSYDKNGNPDAIYDDLRGAHYNRTMQYDGLDRLTAAASASFGGDQWHRFTYDALDNLKSWKLGGVKDYANYLYDSHHRLTQIQNAAGNAVVNLQYDPQGNLSNKDGQAYQFDFGNRLRAATNKESYRYDAEGRRVQQWSPAGGNILSIYSKSGQLMYTEDRRRSQSLVYLYLNGSQVARIRDFTTAPGAPTTSINVSTTYNGSFVVSWSASDLAESYTLEESANGAAWTSVYIGPNNSWNATGKSPGSYSYRVKACNIKGCSAVSSAVAVSVIGAPGAPSISSPAMSTNGAIGVGWSADATASRYELEESANGGAWSTIYNASGNNAALTGRQPGSYSYRVRACNDAGCGGYSSTVTTQVVFPPATAPNLSAPGFVSNGAYTASWSGVTYATSYQLEESVNGGAWTLVHDAGSTSAGFSSKPAATYTYRVRACNTAGCSGYSASQSVQVLYPPSGAPAISAPSVSSDGSYGIGWSVLNGADRYELEESANGGGWTLVYNGSANGYSAVGKADGSYSYRARGCNNAGCSGYSPTANTQVTRPPAAPGSISAPSSSTGTHTISWSAVGNATSYQLEESANGGAWTTIYFDAGTATNVGGRAMGSYIYRVRACNAGGCGSYSGNATVSVVVPPSVPTGLGGNKEPFTSTKYYYDVWWNAVSGTTYYEIQAGSTVHNTGGATSFFIQGGTSMSFKVRACNSAGCSAWSSPVFI